MTFLRNYTIQRRFFILLTLVLVGFVILSWVSLTQAHKSLLQQKHSANQQVVEVAFSVVEHFYQQQVDGALSQDEAQNHAILHLRGKMLAVLKTLMAPHCLLIC